MFKLDKLLSKFSLSLVPVDMTFSVLDKCLLANKDKDGCTSCLDLDDNDHPKESENNYL
jgi:hypothetical protein